MSPAMVSSFTYQGPLLGPSLVSGFFQAGLYGLLAVALVLTYRVSRTVAFVHGGLAILGAMSDVGRQEVAAPAGL
jgi:branched-subunit amino acid ABC-type transport system permease component